MPEEWPGQANLQTRLKKLEGISQSRIAVIAKIAVESVNFYKFVVFAVEHHMKHGDDKARLQGMCVIDAILRAAAEEIPRDKNPYPSRFSKNMAFNLGLVEACTTSDRGKIVRILKIWISAKLLPDKARQLVSDWLQKNNTAMVGAVGEPTSRLLSSIEKLKEGPQMGETDRMPERSPPEEPDTFDYDDEDDDEARLASQARRLEENARKLEAEKETAANAVKHENRAKPADVGPIVEKAPASDAHESDLHRFGFVRHSDPSNVPVGMVRVLSCVLYIGGLPAGFKCEQLRAQIGSFGKIDDIRIVNGPVADSAFVRYIDREEAESAKNLVRSYFSEYKVGWGKGVGVSKDDFDTRQGIGMVPEASLVRSAKPAVPPARPAVTETHPDAAAYPASHGSAAVPGPARAWRNGQSQPPSASWSGAGPGPSPPFLPAANSAAPPRSIGAVPSSWEIGASAPSSSWDKTSSGAPAFRQQGWDAAPGPVPGAWGDVNTGAPPSTSSWDAPGPAHMRASLHELPAPPPSFSPDFCSGSRGGRPDRGGANPPSSSSWDQGSSLSADRRGAPSRDSHRPPVSRGPPDSRRSTFSSRGGSTPWDSGSASKDPLESRGPNLARASQGSGTREGNASSDVAWGNTAASGTAWGKFDNGDPPSTGPKPSAGPAWGDSAPSGRGGAPSWGAGKDDNQGREISGGSSWDGSALNRGGNQGRSSDRFGSGPPWEGGGRSSDRDRPRFDGPKPWGNRDGGFDNDSRRGTPRGRGRGGARGGGSFRGRPRDGGDSRSSWNNNSTDFQGGRHCGGGGAENGSSWGSSTKAPADFGGWSGPVEPVAKSSSGWDDVAASGAAWGHAPSSGSTWNAKPAAKDNANPATATAGWSTPSSADANASNKRGREEGGWGSLPCESEDNKRSRNDSGW